MVLLALVFDLGLYEKGKNNLSRRQKSHIVRERERVGKILNRDFAPIRRRRYSSVLQMF